MDRRGDRRGDPVDDRDDAEVAAGGVEHRRHGCLQAGDSLTAPDQQRAEGEDDGRDREGRLETVPEGEVVVVAAGQFVGVGREQRLDERDHERRDDAGGGEEAWRHCDRGARGVQRAVRDVLLRGEGTPDEAHRVGDGQHRTGERGDEGDPRPGVARDDRVEECREHGLLRDEAEQRGHARHGRGRDDADGRNHGHAPADTRELAPVARARGMVDDADDEEEGRLEERVREQQRDARECRVACAEARHHDEEAELAHGAVGEQQLDVVLAKGAPAADEHRERAEPDDDRVPHLEVGVAGARRATRYTPAFTMAAACR